MVVFAVPGTSRQVRAKWFYQNPVMWIYGKATFGPTLGTMDTEHRPDRLGRARVRQRAQRGVYDRATIDAILDEGLVCHAGFIADGHPVVIPMAYARDEDSILLHGAPGSRLLRTLAGGAPVVVTVTLLDGLVLARSTFHHSMNYRSVVAYGRARPVENTDARAAALGILVEHLVPGRSVVARGPSPSELAATAVIRVTIEEASAKVRSGPPVDDPADHELDVWAGVIPLAVRTGAPLPAPDLIAGPEAPVAWPAGLDVGQRGGAMRSAAGRSAGGEDAASE